MKKFTVTMLETVFYRVEVEAEDERAAALVAEEAFTQGRYETVAVVEREIDAIKEVAE